MSRHEPPDQPTIRCGVEPGLDRRQRLGGQAQRRQRFGSSHVGRPAIGLLKSTDTAPLGEGCTATECAGIVMVMKLTFPLVGLIVADGVSAFPA